MALDPTLPAFAFAPDWSELVRERLSFRTDAIRAEDESEQTASTRLTPRRDFEFAVAEQAGGRQALASLLWGRGAAPLYLPLWTEGTTLASAVAAGAATLPADTTGLDFAVGNAVLLRGPSADQVELVEAGGGIGTGTLALAGTTAQAWPAGTLVLPCRRAYLDPDFSTAAFNRTLSYGRVRLAVAEANPYAADAGATSYRGFPVLTTRPGWARDPETAWDRPQRRVDDDVGLVAVTDGMPAAPLYRQVHAWQLEGRAALVAFRKLVYALRGKRGSLWVPTWLDDLTPVAALGAADTALTVAACGYAAHVAQAVNRRDLRLELADGSVLYRRIVASVDNGDGTETLGLDSALGVAVAAAEFAQVSFLALCRSDADVVEFGWWTGTYADVTTAWRARANDV